MTIAPRALRLFVGALLIAVCSVVLPSPSAAAGTLTRDTDRETAFVANLNAERAARGLRPLVVDSSMSASAASWTRQMVSGSFLAHSDNLHGGVTRSWSQVGENVGRGRTVNSLTSAFMASPTHAQNVLDPSYTHVGVAVYLNPDGRVYTTHRFAAIKGAARLSPQPVVMSRQPERPAQGPTLTARMHQPAASGPTAAESMPSEPDALEQQRDAQHTARMRLMAETFGTGWAPSS